MSPRSYQLGKRAAAAEETRRRILEASLKLHAEKGFAATSWQDIAREADVAVGTVYFHFPTPDELVPACSALGMRLMPMPTPEIFAGVRSRRGRLERLVAELTAFYAKVAAPMAHTFAERGTVAAVGRLADDIQAQLRSLVAEALGPDADQHARTLTESLLDFRVWQAMHERQLSPDDINTTLTRAISHVSTR